MKLGISLDQFHRCRCSNPLSKEHNSLFSLSHSQQCVVTCVRNAIKVMKVFRRQLIVDVHSMTSLSVITSTSNTVCHLMSVHRVSLLSVASRARYSSFNLLHCHSTPQHAFNALPKFVIPLPRVSKETDAVEHAVVFKRLLFATCCHLRTMSQHHHSLCTPMDQFSVVQQATATTRITPVAHNNNHLTPREVHFFTNASCCSGVNVCEYDRSRPRVVYVYALNSHRSMPLQK
jgi:hypothetical protein